ncbi:hypothetical protein K438DRAFT_1497185, partial [Mycena galopus ATCC 62051]
VYVEGAPTSGKPTGPAGAGLFFRLRSPWNATLKVPGPARLTADRARIFAIHEAVRMTPTDRCLLVFCTSKMIIRQICFQAAKSTQLGWPGQNGDLFKSLVGLLGRKAETCFV